MGHSISVYLINKNQLRVDKIEEILDTKKSKNIKWVELGEGILATTRIPNVREFGKDKIITKVETDYFGGDGFQSAQLWENSKRKVFYSDEGAIGIYHTEPINEVLRMIGVKKKSGMDEFDTIGLGKRRSNNDF
jgi:hypothetical protein